MKVTIVPVGSRSRREHGMPERAAQAGTGDQDGVSATGRGTGIVPGRIPLAAPDGDDAGSSRRICRRQAVARSLDSSLARYCFWH